VWTSSDKNGRFCRRGYSVGTPSGSGEGESRAAGPFPAVEGGSEPDRRGKPGGGALSGGEQRNKAGASVAGKGSACGGRGQTVPV